MQKIILESSRILQPRLYIPGIRILGIPGILEILGILYIYYCKDVRTQHNTRHHTTLNTKNNKLTQKRKNTILIF